MVTCENCEHLQIIGGRLIKSRCPITGITFPAHGVSCSTLEKGRIEISPETFCCQMAKEKHSSKERYTKNIINVRNGRVV